MLVVYTCRVGIIGKTALLEKTQSSLTLQLLDAVQPSGSMQGQQWAANSCKRLAAGWWAAPRPMQAGLPAPA